jgi:phosphoribosylamine-glycine ligase
LQSAVNTAQKGCELIQFTDKYFRKDIGYEFA